MQECFFILWEELSEKFSVAAVCCIRSAFKFQAASWVTITRDDLFLSTWMVSWCLLFMSSLFVYLLSRGKVAWGAPSYWQAPVRQNCVLLDLAHTEDMSGGYPRRICPRTSSTHCTTSVCGFRVTHCTFPSSDSFHCRKSLLLSSSSSRVVKRSTLI